MEKYHSPISSSHSQSRLNLIPYPSGSSSSATQQNSLLSLRPDHHSRCQFQNQPLLHSNYHLRSCHRRGNDRHPVARQPSQLRTCSPNRSSRHPEFCIIGFTSSKCALTLLSILKARSGTGGTFAPIWLIDCWFWLWALSNEKRENVIKLTDEVSPPNCKPSEQIARRNT